MDPILIVGPGAVGLTLAARWTAVGEKVLLLGKDLDQETRLLKGFAFIGLDGKAHRVKNGLKSARSQRPLTVRAAFFCTKSFETSKAGADAGRFIGAGTAVVGLQNGAGHETVLRRRFGNRRVVIGSCYFAADRPEHGVITNSWGNKIRLALTDDNADCAFLAQRLLMLGGWDAALKDDEQRLIWTKLIFNAATNPLGALCGVTNGRLAEDEALKEIMLRTLKEAAAESVRLGHVPLYANMDELVVTACRAAPRQRNSMLQDLAAGRKTEIASIADPITRGGRAPTLAALARWVRALEASA